MAEREPEEKPEGRRKREGSGAPNLGRPGEVLLWLLAPGGILVGWALPEWHKAPRSFVLRLPVALHQVPISPGQGVVGMAQLYVALPVEELFVCHGALVGWTILGPAHEAAGLHAQAVAQRTSGLVLPAGRGLAH